MLLRDVRLRRADALADVVDMRLAAGRIAAIAPRLTALPGEEVHDAGGAIAIPGLWDQHVHVGQVAQGYSRLDTSGARGAGDLLLTVSAALAGRPPSAGALVGFGHRLVDFAAAPTVTALDAVAGQVPVVLIGGDAHHAWMSSAALRGLGLPPRDGIVGEDEWFDAVAHLDDLPGVAAGLEAGVRMLQRDALARGVVGLVDMEWAENWRLWTCREARLRVRTATYPSGLDDVPGPSGTVLSVDGLVEMGPLKVIADGALGSGSALCRHAYGTPAGGGHGVLSVEPAALAELLRRGRTLGLETAVHAIGDAAVGIVLDAYAATGTTGRIEHAQMLTDEDVARLAALGVVASVQPAHLLDDRDATTELWGPWAHQAYRFRDLLAAHVRLVLGSDAPVAPVDPWLAMAAAVHRSADERAAWFPAQQLQPHEALAASTDGVDALRVGGVADVVLLDDDPFGDVPTGAGGLMVESAAREAATWLRAVRPFATVVAGRLAAAR